jgi:hypothetical protein
MSLWPIGVAGAWRSAQVHWALQFLRIDSTFRNADAHEPADSPRCRYQRSRSRTARADGTPRGEARSETGRLPESIG